MRPWPCISVALLACGPRRPPEAPPDPATAHIGAWEGSGVAFPEGAACFVFCPDGRAWTANTGCSPLLRDGEGQRWTWSHHQGALLLKGSGEVVLALRALGRSAALIDARTAAGAEYRDLPVDRVGDIPGLCLASAP